MICILLLALAACNTSDIMLDSKSMTLDDVRAIAQKIGANLTLGDLRDFICTDVGSGIYILRFDIEDEYILLVGHGGGDPIYYTIFGRADDANEWNVWDNEDLTIDIRYYDVDKFVSDGTRELVRRPLPETTSPTKETILPNMIVHDITSSGLSFQFENPSDKQYSYSSHYALYVFKNNTWELAEPIIDNWDWVFTDEGYFLLPNSASDLTEIDWRWNLGELPGGQYKFQKEILDWRKPVDFDKYNITYEFTLP